MQKVALIIIYNHRYDGNIDKLEKLYKEKFSCIYHLMPFYDGDKSNVIPVYENSIYFQGYIAQGLKSFYREDFTHYFFIADDLILNPSITEYNYQKYFDVDNQSSFIPHLIQMHDMKNFWPRINEAYYFRTRKRNVDITNELPDFIEASDRILRFGLTFNKLRLFQIWKLRPSSWKGLLKILAFEKIRILKYFASKIFGLSYHLPYPLVGGYSDICIIDAGTIRKFSHFCGVFAAADLHVEVALPTSLCLSAGIIKTETDLNLKGRALWPDGWNRLHGENDLAGDDLKELDKYGSSLNNLLNNFPEDYLYLHPVKLSKWTTE